MDSPQAGIRLNGIEIGSIVINAIPLPGFEGTNFNFNVNVESRIDAGKKLIISITKVEITEVGKEYLLASLMIAIGIEVIDFDKEIVLQEDKKWFIPPSIDAIIKTISISTARGVLFSELRGTYLHKAMLPIVFMIPPNLEPKLP